MYILELLQIDSNGNHVSGNWGICAQDCPNGRDDTGANYGGEWRLVGQMKKKRNGHGMTVINFNEIEDYCT